MRPAKHKLFAALDRQGTLKFVDEVPRGAACECFCPMCASPVVAKQGESLTWHFAHEGGQERVECAVGAANLLRRLAAEHLRSGSVRLPPFVRTFTAEGHRRSYTLDVCVSDVTWHGEVAQHDAWARMELSTAVRCDLFILVDEEPDVLGDFRRSGAGAAVAFRCAIPDADHLVSRRMVLEHLGRHGRFEWLHHEDVDGGQARAQEEVDAIADRNHRARAQAAAARWGDIARRSAASRLADSEAPSPRAPPLDARNADYPWAPDRLKPSSFIFYRLRDGTAWVLYSMVDGRCGVAPWPSPFDGWDESLPPSVGRADLVRAIYVAQDMSGPVIYLSRLAAATRTDSNPEAFRGV